jgi:hypothetical protein
MDREVTRAFENIGISRREAIKRSLATGIAMSVVGPAFFRALEALTEEPFQVVTSGPIVDMINNYIDNTQTPGIAVALFDGNASPRAKIFPVGVIDLTSLAPVEPGVIFEIGSVRKTFTATLLDSNRTYSINHCSIIYRPRSTIRFWSWLS